MKYIITLVLSAVCFFLYAQPNTEVFLADIKEDKGKVMVFNPVNISNNDGYDNQPSFISDGQIVFASTRSGQTDIALKKLQHTPVEWLTNTQMGSEYSPLKIPNENAISAIRLDEDGLQRLYRHNLQSEETSLVLDDAKVGYHLWYSPTLLVATVLIDNRMDLILANLNDNSIQTVRENVGRSLHKIPNSELISFVSTSGDKKILKSFHPATGKISSIINLTEKSEDVCWLGDGSLVTGFGTSLLQYDSKKNKTWELLTNFDGLGIANISRLAVNPSGTKLAFVAEPSLENLVQKQVTTFNEGDLDAFISCFSAQVLVQNFPSDTLYVGIKKMRESYDRFLKNSPNVQVKVVKRIKIGTMVIDEELGTNAGETHQQVALYTTQGGRISSMTFIHDKKTNSDPVPIVQRQLDAYNARDIEAFLDTYDTDVIINNFPNALRFEGLGQMRTRYADFFEVTPDLHCEIKNRIVIGNTIIDEEFITMNGSNFSAVAIYEVANGKIKKVTFVR